MKTHSFLLVLPLCLALAGCGAAADRRGGDGHMPVPTAEEAPEGSWAAAVEAYIAECKAAEEERLRIDQLMDRIEELDQMRSQALADTQLGRDIHLWRERYLTALALDPGPLEGGWHAIATASDPGYVLFFRGQAFVEFHSFEDVRYGTYSTSGNEVTMEGMRDVLMIEKTDLLSARVPETYRSKWSWRLEKGTLVLSPSDRKGLSRTLLPVTE